MFFVNNTRPNDRRVSGYSLSELEDALPSSLLGGHGEKYNNPTEGDEMNWIIYLENIVKFKNNMKTKLLIFSLFLILSTSCVDEDEYVTTYIIENTSNYTISFDFFAKHKHGSFILASNEIKEYSGSPRGNFSSRSFPFEATDSIKVTFNDNVSVFHGSTLYNLERSLLLKSSFKQITDKATLREFEYIFTEEDYQEALSHQ